MNHESASLCGETNIEAVEQNWNQYRGIKK